MEMEVGSAMEPRAAFSPLTFGQVNIGIAISWRHCVGVGWTLPTSSSTHRNFLFQRRLFMSTTTLFSFLPLIGVRGSIDVCAHVLSELMMEV
jgi:hypothetical protein